MTVIELIDKLSHYPNDMTVVVNGYEAGWDDIADIKERVAIKFPTKWYYGDWKEEDWGFEEEIPIGKKEMILHLRQKNDRNR